MANEHINQDNDWATAPPQDSIEQTLFQEYAKQLYLREMKVHQRRQTRMETKAQRYFNSTPSRGAIARVLCIATYVNQPYTKTQISEQIGVSRQAAHDLVEECLAEGWAEQCECCHKHYKATPALIAAGEDYVKFNYETVADSALAHSYAALHAYHKLRQVS